MQDTPKLPFAKWILACVAVAGIATPSTGAFAQANPNMNPGVAQPPPAQGAPGNPMCPRLEAQLATIDHGGGTGDPARDDQIRRYQDAATRQQSELDRVTSQAKRMGCDSSGFFSLFSGQSSQCGPVNTQIQQMRANLDQITSSLERLRGGSGADRDNQRRSVLIALAQNNCGAAIRQHVATARRRLPEQSVRQQQQSGGTECRCRAAIRHLPHGLRPHLRRLLFPDFVRHGAGALRRRRKTCKAECPAAEASLYAYRNPGEDMNQAVSINGAPYTALPNAFRYRQEFTPSCSCKAPGQSWTDALKNVDDKAIAEQQGDIIVTEESAKKMARPQQTPAPKSARKGATPPGAAAAAPPAEQAGTTGVTPPPGDKSIRTVGPTFIPAR